MERVRRRCVEEGGWKAALGRKEQLNRRRKKLDGQGEAHLTRHRLVANRRRAVPVGRCNCWLTGWCNVR